MHAEPPEYIKAAVNRIMNDAVSEGRLAELRVIAQTFLNNCLEKITSNSGEDGFVEQLKHAIRALGFKDLCHDSNAN
jgi:hypothetical protein